MSNLGRAVIAAVIVAVVWNLGPVKAWRGQAFGILKSGTNAITGRDAVDIGQDLKRQQVQNTLGRALREYRQMNDADPRSLQDLVTAGLLQKADINDEWGRALETEPGPNGLVVRGLGADGRRGTPDDWTLEK
jgi:hypothetical protein